MFLQYLSPMLIFILMSVIGLRWHRIGGSLFILLGFGFCPWFFNRLTVATVGFLMVPLALLGLLYWFGRPRPKKWAHIILIGLPVVVMLIFGTPNAIRVAQRVNDGNLGARLVEGNGVRLVWAPDGPGWPKKGVTWYEAQRICERLSEDGTRLEDKPQHIWRLPTVDEAVRSQARHGKNAGGVWDSTRGIATYKITPDKETPLWNVHSQVIYWWTATEVDESTAYIIAYNGRVWKRNKNRKPGYLAFRAVKEPGEN